MPSLAIVAHLDGWTLFRGHSIDRCSARGKQRFIGDDAKDKFDFLQNI